MDYTHDHAEGIFPDIYESEQGQYIHTVLRNEYGKRCGV